MMVRRILFQLCLLSLVGFVFLMSSASQSQYSARAEGSPANRNWTTLDANGKVITCSGLPEVKGGVILGYIVPCITKTIENTTIRFSTKMIEWLRPTLYAFITLVIVLFGVRVLQGGGQVHSEAILLLLKIGLVIAVLDLIPGYFVPQLYNVMNETQEVVAGTIGPDSSSIKCDMSHYQGGETLLVWAQMDCLVGKLYGITIGDGQTPGGKDRPNMLLAASIFGLMGGFFFGGTFGAILFLTLLGVLWTMFMIVIRTASGFLNAYLYASMMMIIAPLFLPLILLRQTATYFEPWWKGILASILMPMIITAYAMFAMILYDKMLFADDSLLQNLFNNKLVEKIQGMPKPVCSKATAGNNTNRADWGGIADISTLYKNNPFMRGASDLLMGSNDLCMGMQRPSLEMQNLLKDNKTLGTTDDETPKAIFTKMFYDAVKLLVLSILISLGYTNMQTLARLLIGSGATASLLEPKGQLETKFAGMKVNAKSAFTHSFDQEGSYGGAAGPDFIKRLSDVPENVVKGVGRSL
jgi:type IV secretory pathway VirB6-like protein